MQSVVLAVIGFILVCGCCLMCCSICMFVIGGAIEFRRTTVITTRGRNQQINSEIYNQAYDEQDINNNNNCNQAADSSSQTECNLPSYNEILDAQYVQHQQLTDTENLSQNSLTEIREHVNNNHHPSQQCKIDMEKPPSYQDIIVNKS
jgi:hypothetical protein